MGGNSDMEKPIQPKRHIEILLLVFFGLSRNKTATKKIH